MFKDNCKIDPVFCTERIKAIIKLFYGFLNKSIEYL